jgi:hypothetical protein
MEEDNIAFLNKCGIQFSTTEQLNGQLIPRDVFLSNERYNLIRDDIKLLKQRYSSSTLTSLQNNAGESQKWPLLNLVRQILRANDFIMKPVRRADGATKDGKKKYKRFFLISSIASTSTKESDNA